MTLSTRDITKGVQLLDVANFEPRLLLDSRANSTVKGGFTEYDPKTGKARSWSSDLVAKEVSIGTVACAVVLGAVAVINSYPMPELLARKYAEENGIAWPADGLTIPQGLAAPVLIAIVVALAVAAIVAYFMLR